MSNYVIRNDNNLEFLSKIDNSGIVTTAIFRNAMIFTKLDKAEIMLKFIDNEDYEINEIEFKTLN